ncbi:MAG: MYXO-CTERM sorting domain-containing protein [Myxococcota bacterium]
MWLFTAARAQTADFDGLVEGTNATTITDGGLTFENLDFRDGTIPPGVLTIEQADGTLAGLAGFTPNNTLAFGGFSAGAGAAFTRFGQVDVINGGTADAAELTAFEFGSTAGTWLELDAFSAGVLVASDRENLVGGFVVTPHTLSVSGATFDRLTLRVGPTAADVAFLLVDHVVLTAGSDTGETGDTGAPLDTATDDTGAEPEDTAAPAHTADTGAPPDSGTSGGSDGTDTPDGPPADTGPGDSGAAKEDTGCGCAAGPRPAGWLAGVALAVGLRRRRR